MTDFGNGLLVAIGIGLLIFVHELGHYLAARFIGARVEVFSLGFGPRLCGFRRGPTDYRLSLIPLGGYVAVTGQDPEDLRHPEASLQSKSVGARFMFFLGGVLMNLLFALVAFPLAFGSGVSFPAPVIGFVAPGSPAWEAGIEAKDRVLSINGKETYSFENLVVEVALAGGRSVVLEIERDGEVRHIEATPRFSRPEGIYMLGFELAVSDALAVLDAPEGSPAHAAGLRSGDLLVAVDGRPARSDAAFDEVTQQKAQAGEPLEITAIRTEADGTRREMHATIKPLTRPAERAVLGIEPLRSRVEGLRHNAIIQRLGLMREDVLLAIDGAAFSGQSFAGTSPTLRLAVRRRGLQVDLHAEATTAERQSLEGAIALTAAMDDTSILPAPASAAATAGLRPGDRILSIDGEEVSNWQDLQGRVRAADGRSLSLVVERIAEDPTQPASVSTFAVTPRRAPVHDYGYTRQIERMRHEVRADSMQHAVQLGAVCALDLVKQLYVTTKRLLTGEVAASNLGGIIQISRVSYHNTQWGFPRFLYFLALLSINLAFVNILPVPVLDGGHLLFLLIEKIKGSPVSVRVFQYSQVLGLVLVLALVVFVTYNDILRLL